MASLAFKGLWPPTVNHVWKKTGSGRVYLSKEGRGFRSTIGWLAKLARNDGVLPQEPFKGPLRVAVRLAPPDRRRRDIDNVCKALFDALTHAGVWEDDRQIMELEMAMDAPVKGGSVKLEIEAMENGEQ